MNPSLYATDDARWAAIAVRDRDAEGAFYVAVKTTGVYCLPSCSGRPLRRNISFHDTAQSARAAGYRACLRCRPDAPRETLRYGVVQTPLGLVLAATSPAGLRLVILGDARQDLISDLAARFPKSRLEPDEAGLADVLKAVANHIADPHRTLDLPLDAQGSPLQATVWSALRAIPVGRTASYAEIARAVGRPTAARAMAQACGANPLAVIVPCHRVVRTDGALSGYRWGVERKRALLALEAAA